MIGDVGTPGWPASRTELLFDADTALAIAESYEAKLVGEIERGTNAMFARNTSPDHVRWLARRDYWLAEAVRLTDEASRLPGVQP